MRTVADHGGIYDGGIRGYLGDLLVVHGLYSKMSRRDHWEIDDASGNTDEVAGRNDVQVRYKVTVATTAATMGLI